MNYSFSDTVKLAACGQWNLVLQILCCLTVKETTPSKKECPVHTVEVMTVMNSSRSKPAFICVVGVVQEMDSA